MLNTGLKKRVPAREDRVAAKDRLSIATACYIGIGLLVPACAVTWVSLKWERLDARADIAEAQLASAQQELADRAQRTDELRGVEASLRDEMSQLSGLVDQADSEGGIGVSRATISAAFNDLGLINKDQSSHHDSEHYAIESVAGSIQLRGPPNNLKQIEFFGELQGGQSEASTDMLVTLLGAVAPQWEAAPRASWLAKLTNIEDDVRVYKDIDRLRVNWYWTNRDGVRLDVLSIEPN